MSEENLFGKSVFTREFEIIRVSPRRTRSFCFGKRTQNQDGPVVALRVPYAVRRIRRRRKLAELVLSLAEGLKQCAAVSPELPARLSHAKGQRKKYSTIPGFDWSEGEIFGTI